MSISVTTQRDLPQICACYHADHNKRVCSGAAYYIYAGRGATMAMKLALCHHHAMALIAELSRASESRDPDTAA